MRTFYDSEDDILTLRISDKPVAREVSPDWHTCISYAEDGSVVEVVLLDFSQYDDASFMAMVLGNVARARNLSELARETGIARETLYKVTRGEGNPTLETVGKLARALGFRLSLTPLAAKPT